MIDYDVLIDKAYEKSRKFAKKNGCVLMEPSMDNCGCENHDGKEYVILRDTSQILSVWRVRNGGKLTSVDYEDLPESLQEEIRITG